MQRQGAVNIDLCLTPHLVGGQTPKRSEHAPHPHPPLRTIPASPHLTPAGQGNREVKSMDVPGSSPSSVPSNMLSALSILSILFALQFLWLSSGDGDISGADFTD